MTLNETLLKLENIPQDGFINEDEIQEIYDSFIKIGKGEGRNQEECLKAFIEAKKMRMSYSFLKI